MNKTVKKNRVIIALRKKETDRPPVESYGVVGSFSGFYPHWD
jgi:hypothetical protein